MSIPEHENTRIETYLAKICGKEVQLTEPRSRLELFYAKWAGMNVELPTGEYTLKERWLLAAMGEDDIPEQDGGRFGAYVKWWFGMGDEPDDNRTRIERYWREIADVWAPVGFERLKYIESTGTQYIDTGHIPSKNLRVKALYLSKKKPGDVFQSLCGTQNTSSGGETWAVRYGAQLVSTNLKAQFIAIPPTLQIIELDLPSDDFISAKRLYSLDFGSGRFSIDQYEAIGSPITDDAPFSLYLLARNSKNVAEAFSAGLLYSAECWDGSWHISLVPCCRKSDHKPGMYDLVTRSFFTNKGTGEFLIASE